MPWRGRLFPRSEARELVSERSESHAAQIEGVAMESLQVEVASVPLLRIRSRFEPNPLADLVADRLTRPSEVAIDLAAHEVFGFAAALDHERKCELAGPDLPGVIALALRNR